MKKLTIVLTVSIMFIISSCEKNEVENTINQNQCELIFDLRPGAPDEYRVSQISLGISREADGQVDEKSVHYFINPKLGDNKLLLDYNSTNYLAGRQGVYFFLAVFATDKNGEEILLCSKFIELEQPLKTGTNHFSYVFGGHKDDCQTKFAVNK